MSANKSGCDHRTERRCDDCGTPACEKCGVDTDVGHFCDDACAADYRGAWEREER